MNNLTNEQKAHLVNDKNWMCSKSGIFFSIKNPKVENIYANDIAHGLSLLCRFNGQINEFYSVAQHSVEVSKIVPPKYAMYALMHDASEAYIGDVISPLKRILGDTYANIEYKFMKVVARKFDFKMGKNASKEVKKADMIMLRTEMRDLSNFNFLEGERLNDVIKPLTWYDARSLFIIRYHEILENINGCKQK